ncbi:MAG TPA: rhombosortase [Steroidobacteraceae bacterium]|nr:rhombosortase [Steroidobacteraceae bacterium]
MSANAQGGLHRTLRSLNCDGGHGIALALACALLLASEIGGDAARRALRFDRGAVASGEWWRLVTGHLVHLSLWHAVLNSLALALLWALFERDYTPRDWVLVLAGAVAAIDIGLWIGDSTVLWYVGSSGALHGVLAAGTLAHLKRREWDGLILAVLLASKLAYEQWVGPLPFVTGATVVVDAHLYGALGGLTVALALGTRRKPL